MQPILAGLETEYGLVVEDRSVSDQVDDATAFVRAYTHGSFEGWDYRYESPRTDLRGFQVSHLAFDPDDAQFDVGRTRSSDAEIRSDRILPNGARFYNDHGHPEYATPECWSIRELGLHDEAGQMVLLESARLLSQQLNKDVRVYKNNTDFHGSSYGSHESCLVPREIGFDRLYKALLPLLVCRQVLVGAGKAGFEKGSPAEYQMSQRADFFAAPVNLETLYNRPIFNTRDEPHADPQKWIRLHVICGDANMIPGCTVRRIGLLKLGLLAELSGRTPGWTLADPVRDVAALSRCFDSEGRIALAGGSWTTPRQILESYLDAAEPAAAGDQEMVDLIAECRMLLEIRFSNPEVFAFHVDWAAKLRLLKMAAEEGVEWGSSEMQSYDLAYHDIDPERGLLPGLAAMGWTQGPSDPAALRLRLAECQEPTRAKVRGLAVSRFSDQLKSASWGTLTFRLDEGEKTAALPPDLSADSSLMGVESAEELCSRLLQ